MHVRVQCYLPVQGPIIPDRTALVFHFKPITEAFAMIVDTLDIFQQAVTAGLLTFSINLRAFIRLVKPQKKLTESG